MFASVGRRLALLNAAVVTLAIALTGLITYLLMDASLTNEADSALEARIAAGRDVWSDDMFERGHDGEASSGDGDGDWEREWQDLVEGDDVREAAREAVGWLAPGLAVDEEDRGEAGELFEEIAAQIELQQRSDAAEPTPPVPDPEVIDELLESGDTLLYAFRGDGELFANRRGIPVPGLPVADSVAEALKGRTDTREVTIGDELVRVRTEPVRHEGEIIGAIQAARGEHEHIEELRLIRNVTLAGVGLGALLAIPAGLWLSRRAMAPIRAAFARQQAFVADASHELRTPLAIIRANTEVAQRMKATPPEVRAELGEVIAEVDVAARLVDDLLLLARSDSASLPMRLEPLDLGALVRAAAEPLAPVAAAAGLEMTVETQPAMVRADADRIQQALRVLIDNAIAYTPAGGAIRVSAGPAKGGGRVEVRDSGIGLSAEDRERVFERFFRAERSRSRASGGAGLGLAIAQAIVTANGGRIGVESEPGAGSTFWVTLPGGD